MRRHIAETTLQLAKRCGIDAKAEVVWDHFPEKSDARWALWKTMEALRPALAKVLSWDEGRDTVAAKVKSLRLSPAGTSSVVLQGDVLTIAIANPIDEASLHRMIESAL